MGVAPYERSAERNGQANGFKERTLSSRLGQLNLCVPQVRGSAEAFRPQSLEAALLSEKALKVALAEMYVQGVSTRRVSAVLESLCGVSFRNALCKVQDIESGVGVSVQRERTYRAEVPTLFQWLFTNVTAPGTRLRSVCRIDLCYRSRGAFSLRGENRPEQGPGGIADVLVKGMVLDHPLDVQFFNGDKTVLIDQSPRQLVNKIVAAITNPFMDTRQNLVCFSARLATLRSSGLLSARLWWVG